MAEFNAERNGTGTKEWSETSVNIQKGCQNDCKYCYAAQMANRFGWRKREDWSREELTKQATRELFPARKGVVMFPTSHDITPFNLDASVGVLKRNLERGNKVLIVTKPRLECIQRLITELEPWKDQIMFRFTIGSLSDDTTRFWEPGAPLPSERLACLSLAFEAGFKTSVSAEPLLGGAETGIEVVEACRPYVTETIWLGKMNRVQVATEDAEAAKEMKWLQRDEEIIKLYNHFKTDSVVSWKDSIRAVVVKHSKRLVWTFAMPTTELMRLSDITRELCISKSTWYQGIKDGRFPKPVKLGGGKTSAWKTSEIRALIDAGQS